MLHVLLRLGVAALTANAVALLLTAVGNTAANRRLIFEVRGPHHRPRHHSNRLAVLAAGLVLTSGALAMLHAAAPEASAPRRSLLTVTNSRSRC